MNILLAEDNPDMQHIVKRYLEKEGHQVFVADDGQAALAIFYEQQIHLAILDWMMPKKSGLEVLKEIKAQSKIKVLMLTAKNLHEDQLESLKLGADDYVTKPFHPQVLLLRVKKLLGVEEQVAIGKGFFDFPKREFLIDGQALALTKIEADLLLFFVQHPNQILTREQLLIHVWGMDYDGDDRTVDTHIKRLREKIGFETIKTIRGVGYQIETATV
ncbi:response regulator transcription factor [uncultured Vagococcus sp.]|uniref:response regulator transcription factor n=1 Tax=uncultured Vagococcus sp. TaxID=189676 RepID=UPI0028D3FB4F|nr:response regulator transcription factor [uncultured Vagococcus sp.]